MLSKNPGVTAIAIITLALGIGANTAIFSIVNGVLLRPLSYKDPDRIVSLWETTSAHGRWRVSSANFFEWKNQNTVFDKIAAFGGSSLTLTGDGDPIQLQGARVSSEYFSVIGVNPILGRTFLPEEYEPGKGQVTLLSYALWQSRYGSDPNVTSKTVTLNGERYSVVGVMPPGLYPMRPTTGGNISFAQEEQQFWTPIILNPKWADAHVLGVVAHLKHGVSLEQANSEMVTIGARLEQEKPANKGAGVVVKPFMSEVVGNVKPALYTLLGAVALVLLIACANIAGLMLAQHAARTKEIAIRAALGAGRSRLIRQFLIEGVLLTTLGTMFGIGLAWFGMRLMLTVIPNLPRLDQVKLDYRVLAFTFALSVLTCLVFGLVPALRASKPDLNKALEQSGRSSGPGAARSRLRQALVVFQVSMAIMLVIGAGLLIKSFWLLQRVDPGFKPDNILSVGVTLPAAYSEPVKINDFFNRLTQSISVLPGVKDVSIAYDQPLESNWIDSFELEGFVKPPEIDALSANFNPVSPDYFRTVGAKIISGREFTAQDDRDHPGVAIVNQAFVRQYFPNEQPIGRIIRPSPPARIWKKERLTSFEIVGIANDVKSAGLRAATEPAYYLPAAQAPLGDMTVLVHTESEPTSLIPAVRRAVLEIDPNQPIANVNTLENIVSTSIAQPRLNMFLMGLFGGLALLLAGVGIYGLLSYAVTQRTQEMGIRMALGAQVHDVLGLVLKQGMSLAVLGEVLGLIGAFALTRFIQTLLYGVTPTDATIFIAVVGILTFIALLACFFPARRATRVDPLIALRYE
jgi:putative ABC transport system permease protein